MELNIYNKEGMLKATMSPNDTSTQTEGVMQESILSLSFTHPDCIGMDVNDYVDYLGKRYWVLETYIPNQKSTIEWLYNIKLYGIESVIRRALCLKMVDNELNPVFALTAPAIEHVRLVVQNINRVMSTTDWKVGEVEATANLTIDYNGTYCNDALSAIATAAAETEWWIDGLTVNLCRCEHGALVELGYENGLKEITLDTNENAKFFTRLFPLGSSRNIDLEQYGSSRLHLPGGVNYVEQNTHYGVIEHYEEAAFAAIYPRRVGKVGVVRKETKTGENGKPFDIYYFTDPELNFNANDYEIGGLIKHIVFETGDLAGRDFEVNYNDSKKEFEIVTQFLYDDNTQLPGVLVMKPSDEYILYNIKMPVEYYGIAEAEFAAAVTEYMAKNKLDKSVYKAPTDYIDLGVRDISLTIGQRVRLMSDKYCPITGYRDSRISKITRKVNEPLSADIEISDLANPGGKAVIEQGISQAKHYAQAAMAGLPEMIKSWENTPESDSNLYTAKKTMIELLKKALRRDQPDYTNHLLKLLGGIAFHDNYGITPDGEAFLHILRLTGFLEAPEYRYNRIDVTTGDKWNAPGGGVIESVDTENQIITLKLEDGEVGAIELDDICMSIFHNKEILNNATSTIDDGRGNRMIVGFATSYFRIVEILDERKQTFRYALRGVSDRWNMSIHPSPMSHFPVYGNFSNPERQSSSYSTRTYTRFLRNVSDWEFSAYNVAAQFGDPSNLSAFGLDMTGYSAYLDNIYMTGRIDMSAHIPDRMEFEASNGYSLSVGEYTDITAYLYNGWDDITEKYTSFIWTRDSGVAQEDAAWNIAHKTSEKTLTLSFSDLNTRRVVFSCTATKPGAKAIVGNLIV